MTLISRQPWNAPDRGIGMLVAHVERRIRADADVVGPHQINQVAQRLRIEDEAIEI